MHQNLAVSIRQFNYGKIVLYYWSQINRRCFDLILIGIKMKPRSVSGSDPLQPQDREVLVSLLQLFEAVFRETFWHQLAFIFIKDSTSRGGQMIKFKNIFMNYF